MSAQLFIGLMSGTSADSIDAALLSFEDNTANLLAHHSADISDLQKEIFALAQPGENEIQRLNQLDRELGIRFAEATNHLLTISNRSAGDVAAIGSHGQTIRHQPPGCKACEHAFSHQIGDPNTIAFLTGITTVADFRRRDIAAGGQGAPLVPAFHRAVFEKNGVCRAIVNIGGMANITCLPGDGTLLGFDTGPGNVLMDGWIKQHLQQPYDNKGQWATTGELLPELLQQMLQHPYFSLPAPKSTGREAFNMDWLASILPMITAAEDVQATLLDLTAASIVDALTTLPGPVEEIYLCGGGAFNTALINRIATLATPVPVNTTAALGMDPKWVEAAAFAWLARQTLANQSGNAPEATGASRALVLGGIYPA